MGPFFVSQVNLRKTTHCYQNRLRVCFWHTLLLRDMTMSTADCKVLLAEHYSGTLAKDWKRESKYKNALEQDVRRFVHPASGVAYLVDNGWNEVGKDGEQFEFKMASTYTVSDFYFGVVVLPADHEPVTAQIWVAYKHSFDRIPEADDIHWEWLMKKWLPKDLNIDESMESCFEITDRLTKAEIIQRFSDSGFTHSHKFDAHIHEAIGVPENPLDFYFYVDDDFNDHDDLQVYITPRAYFEAHRCVECVHISDRVDRIFPDGLSIDEEMESCFRIAEVKDVPKVTQMFLDKGFLPMPDRNEG